MKNCKICVKRVKYEDGCLTAMYVSVYAISVLVWKSILKLLLLSKTSNNIYGQNIEVVATNTKSTKGSNR